MKRHLFGCALFLLALLPGPGSQQALAAYPERPIKIIIIAGPGGGMDIFARTVGEYISKKLGQPVVVESVTGAGGNIAMDQVAHAKPDGYTLLVSSPSMVTNFLVHSKVRFNPETDFTFITLALKQYFLWVVNSDFPVKSVPEAIAYAKANPGKMTVGNGAIGTTSYLAPVLVNKMANIQLNIVNYKGNSPAIVDLQGGHINAMFTDPLSIAPALSTGKVRAIGITSLKRLPGFPDVPAVADVLPGYTMGTAFGLSGPAGMPKEIVETLNKAAVEALRDPVIRANFEKQNAEVIASTPEEYAAEMKADFAKYKQMISELNLRLD